MGQDPTAMIALGSMGVVGLSVASAAVLKGWTAWLELKRLELTSGRAPSPPTARPFRAEVSDLKERVRKLEAIANGADR